LDVSSCVALWYFDCSNNQLTNLDVSNNTVLKSLDCYTNQINCLDVSNNTDLEYLDCGFNGLTSLDVSNNTELDELYLSDMPILYEVCIREMPFPPYSVDIDTTGSPNVYFTTSCWAEPPTVYDTIFYIEENSPDKTVVGYVQATDPENNLLDFAIIDGNINETFSINNQGELRVENTDALDYENIPQFILTVVVKEVIEPIFSDTANVTIKLQDVVETSIRAHESLNKLKIYPNPSDDMINIEIENTINSALEIYNVSGRLVFSKKLNSKVEKIDVSDFTKGIYIFKVIHDSAVNISKVVVR
jgi:hypothetical protein